MDQLAAARLDHKVISMLYNSSTEKPLAYLCVLELVPPWMLMRILHCWIEERISEHAQTPWRKPFLAQRGILPGASHDDAYF